MKWINAKDELPNEDEMVLVCFCRESERTYRFAWWIPDKEKWWYERFYSYKHYNPIYWTRDYKME